MDNLDEMEDSGIGVEHILTELCAESSGWDCPKNCRPTCDKFSHKRVKFAAASNFLICIYIYLNDVILNSVSCRRRLMLMNDSFFLFNSTDGRAFSPVPFPYVL